MSIAPILSPELDPSTVPCPPWCTLTAHHAYESTTGGIESRWHGRRISAIDVDGGAVLVEIIQEESRRILDSAVGVEWPGIDLTVDLLQGFAPSLTVDQAQGVADALQSAAVVLDEITGGRTNATEQCQHPAVAPAGMTTDQCQSCGETWHTLVRAADAVTDSLD